MASAIVLLERQTSSLSCRTKHKSNTIKPLEEVALRDVDMASSLL